MSKINNLIIRNIEASDIPDVVQIRIDGWRSAYQGIVDDEYLNSMNAEERIKKRLKDFKDSGFIVAELDGEIVGFCRYINNGNFTPNIPDIDCEILALYVKPELKNNGIGTAMLKYVVTEFKRVNKRRMILWCLKDNEPSKAFYSKMGGEIKAEKETEIGGKKYTEVGFLYQL